MKHYVYIHRRADTGDIFYVGKGCKARAWDRAGRNPDWHATAAEGGLVVEPIAYFHEHADAIEHEKATIRELGLWEPLVNRTCGGEGSAGWKATPEMLAAMSVRSKTLHEDPEFKAKMARVYADPEYIAKHKARYATPGAREAARQQSLRHLTPEDRARYEKNLVDRAAKAAWRVELDAQLAELMAQGLTKAQALARRHYLRHREEVLAARKAARRKNNPLLF